MILNMTMCNKTFKKSQKLIKNYHLYCHHLLDLHKHKCISFQQRYTRKNWIHISFSSGNELAQRKNIQWFSMYEKHKEFWFEYVQIYLKKQNLCQRFWRLKYCECFLSEKWINENIADDSYNSLKKDFIFWYSSGCHILVCVFLVCIIHKFIKSFLQLGAVRWHQHPSHTSIRIPAKSICEILFLINSDFKYFICFHFWERVERQLGSNVSFIK